MIADKTSDDQPPFKFFEICRALLVGVIVSQVCMGLCGTSARAAFINLTAAGSSGTINGAIYEQAGPQSTGTGTIDTFAQQSAGGSSTTSHAYNTTVNNVL